jgi:hypothetical protein
MKHLAHIKKDLRDLDLNISSVEYLLNFALNNRDQLSLAASKADLVTDMSPFLYRAIGRKGNILKAIQKLGIYNLLVTSKENDKFTILFKHKDGGLISSEVIRDEYSRKPNMTECLALTILDYAEQISNPEKLASASNAFKDAELSAQLKAMMENMQKNTSEEYTMDKEWPDALERNEAITGEFLGKNELDKTPGLTLDQAPPGLKEAFMASVQAEKLKQELGHDVTIAIPH